MQRHAHRALAHAELCRRVADAGAFERNRPDDRSLAAIEPIDQPHDLPPAELLLLIGAAIGQRVGQFIDRDLRAAAAPAQRIDELVAGDRRHPRPDQIGLPPGMAVQMDGEQRLLHNVLRIASGRGSTSVAHWPAAPAPTPQAADGRRARLRRGRRSSTQPKSARGPPTPSNLSSPMRWIRYTAAPGDRARVIGRPVTDTKR